MAIYPRMNVQNKTLTALFDKFFFRELFFTITYSCIQLSTADLLVVDQNELKVNQIESYFSVLVILLTDRRWKIRLVRFFFSPKFRSWCKFLSYFFKKRIFDTFETAGRSSTIPGYESMDPKGLCSTVICNNSLSLRSTEWNNFQASTKLNPLIPMSVQDRISP